MEEETPCEPTLHQNDDKGHCYSLDFSIGDKIDSADPGQGGFPAGGINLLSHTVFRRMFCQIL